MVDVAARRTRTRSRFYRLIGVRDLGGHEVCHGPAILTEDEWGDWKGVLHRELRLPLGERVIVWTPDGDSLCVVEDKSNGQTLLIGVSSAPF